MTVWFKAPLAWRNWRFSHHERKVLLALSILIGALTGLTVVALILLTERLGARIYPVQSPIWHRILIPVIGSLGTGIWCSAIFPTRAAAG